jgi:hypothetical protein
MLKEILFQIRAVVMTVSLSISLAMIPGFIAGAGAMYVAFFLGASNQVSAKVGIGYVGFPVFLSSLFGDFSRPPPFYAEVGLFRNLRELFGPAGIQSPDGQRPDVCQGLQPT